MNQHLFLGLLWIAYCVLHSVLASLEVKKRAENYLGKGFKYYRFAYVIFSFAGLGLLIYYNLRITPIIIFKDHYLLKIAGGILAVPGFLLMLVCIRKYFMSLSGLRSLLYNEDHPELMIAGIHNYVRHPLYLGTFAFIWGIFLWIPHLSVLILNVIITIYTLIGMELEERKLMAAFGEQYKNYREIVPGLWPSKRAAKKFRKPNV